MDSTSHKYRSKFSSTHLSTYTQGIQYVYVSNVLCVPHITKYVLCYAEIILKPNVISYVIFKL